ARAIQSPSVRRKPQCYPIEVLDGVHVPLATIMLPVTTILPNGFAAHGPVGFELPFPATILAHDQGGREGYSRAHVPGTCDPPAAGRCFVLLLTRRWRHRS